MLAILAIAGLLGLGLVYRAGYLLPKGESTGAHLLWVANNLLIYSPIFLVLILRRQRTETIFLSPRGLPRKLLLGVASALASVTVFLALRGELGRLPSVLGEGWTGKRIADFVPVFLEGVALAFLLVRLRWVWGRVPAALIPALLFAAAHIASQLAEGRGVFEIVSFFVVNTALVAIVLLVLQRSTDIIWLGLVHYLMDVAIGAV